MNSFVMFQKLLLYSRTVKWDWTELAQDRATVKSVGEMQYFGMFQNPFLYSQKVKLDWTELAQDRATVNVWARCTGLGCSITCYSTLRR